MTEHGPSDSATLIVQVRSAEADQIPISRSQAKTLLGQTQGCRTVALDFSGVRSIGQAFADEIFRVFANEHPHIELIAMHATPEVQQMIRRAEVLRDKPGGQLPLLK
jgi:hypothetical protein